MDANGFPPQPTADPGAGSGRWSGAGRRWLGAGLRSLALLLLAAVAGAAGAYGVTEYRMRAEHVQAVAQANDLRAEVRRQQDELTAKVLQVEKAAQAAGLLMQRDGELTTLDARLREIDNLKLELQRTRTEMDAKLKEATQSIVDQVARQGSDTAQALSLEMRWRSLLIKAQGEVLLAQVHWAEGNRGLARDELAIAGTSLRRALEVAPDQAREPMRQVVEYAEQTRSALILEQSSARDSLNLLWRRVSDLLAPAPGTAR